MNKSTLLLFLFVLLSAAISCNDDSNEKSPEEKEEPVVFDVEIGESVIPYIVINTDGIQIENEPKIPAELVVYMEKEEVLRTHIGIEYRGSTSFRLSNKKSYGIETWDADGSDIDVGFFDFPKEEDFILSGHIVNLGEGYIFDRTLMYHYFGYTLYREMGRYGSRTKWVELELNGDYLGVYVFMEKLKRDTERINITELMPTDITAETITGGYILKIDKTAGGDLDLNQPLSYYEDNWDDDARYNEFLSFRSQYDINGGVIDFAPYGEPYHPNQYLETYFLYEEPAPEDITTEQRTYIQEYINDFETALLTDDFNTPDRTYTDYIDLDSFVDFFIINEVCRNIDGYRLSTWLYKDRGGKLTMGPIWDLNIGFDSNDRVPIDGWVINYNDFVAQDAWSMPFWWPRLMEDPQFRLSLKTRWNQLRGGALSTPILHQLVDESADHLSSNGAIARNYEKWDIGVPVDYDQSISNLKSFLMERTSWMDEQIGSF